MVSDEEISKKLQEMEKKVEYVVEEMIEKAEELGIVKRMDRNGLNYKNSQKATNDDIKRKAFKWI